MRWFLAVALVLAIALAPRARACAAFVPSGQQARPALARERVLVVHDAARSLEHFLREAVFTETGAPFAFVVPVPARPDVQPVRPGLFDRLEQTYPFERKKLPRAMSQGMAVSRGPTAAAASKVHLLEEKNVGRFRAYVLTVEGAEGLDAWLAQHGFASGPAERAWLDPYVRRGWHFVALKAETGRGGPWPGRLVTETVRISFETSVPVYPYREPAHEAAARDRVLSVWLLTDGPARTPVALDESGRPVRPWRAGQAYANLAPIALRSIAKEEAATWIPSGKLHLQVFEDQKFSRKGIGDAWLVAPEPGHAPAQAGPEVEALVAKGAASGWPERATPEGRAFDAGLRERLAGGAL